MTEIKLRTVDPDGRPAIVVAKGRLSGNHRDRRRSVMRLCYRRCWQCTFDDDIDHEPCDGDSTDTDDIDWWLEQIKVYEWLHSLGPIPAQGPGLHNHPGPRPHYRCACWCQQPDLYRAAA